jgi:hypothetical protein
MSEGMETHVSDAPAQPASGGDVAAPEPVNLEVPADSAPPEEPALDEAPAVEFDEIEYDGEKYSVPKKLKDGFLMQSDYTRKTQEVAEQRKAIEAERESIKQRAEAERANIRDVAQIYGIDEQLTELDKIDWVKLGNEDPFEAQKLFQQRSLMKERRDRLVAELQQKEFQRSQEAQQEFAKRYADTNEALNKSIPGWNQDLALKMREFAKANDLNDEDIRHAADKARWVKLLHKAYVGDQLINAKTSAAQEPRVEPKPLAKVTGSGARTPKTPESATDMESYVRLRRAQGFGSR